jgi:2-polyprenyl-3-methyl-5-hydroxy-6-metoxy-1,4-benzoquinol methylase
MSYIKKIQESIKSGKVIHVGAVGTSDKQLKRHSMFKSVAKNIVGFDHDEKLVKVAKKKGFSEIFLADVTNSKNVDNIIKKFGQFDHVVMTEVIEHIGNLTSAFNNIHRLMNENGKLYISTPNLIRAKKGVQPNPDHICWFCEFTVTTLLRRSHLKVISVKDYGNKMLVIAEK